MTDLELANKIAKACDKLSVFGASGNQVEIDENEPTPITIGGDELTILFHNEKVVAFTTWNYDGTWFAVVDLEKEELIMSSCDSIMFNEEDKLILYNK